MHAPRRWAFDLEEDFVAGAADVRDGGGASAMYKALSDVRIEGGWKELGNSILRPLHKYPTNELACRKGAAAIADEARGVAGRCRGRGVRDVPHEVNDLVDVRRGGMPWSVHRVSSFSRSFASNSAKSFGLS